MEKNVEQKEGSKNDSLKWPQRLAVAEVLRGQRSEIGRLHTMERKLKSYIKMASSYVLLPCSSGHFLFISVQMIKPQMAKPIPLRKKVEPLMFLPAVIVTPSYTPISKEGFKCIIDTFLFSPVQTSLISWQHGFGSQLYLPLLKRC